MQGWEGDYPLGIALEPAGTGAAREPSRRARNGGTPRWGTRRRTQGALHVLPGAVAAAYEADVATVRAALGEEAFATAREAGRALPLEEAVAEAHRLAEEWMSVQH